MTELEVLDLWCSQLSAIFALAEREDLTRQSLLEAQMIQEDLSNKVFFTEEKWKLREFVLSFLI